jgi:5'-nucleotidase
LNQPTKNEETDCYLCSQEAAKLKASGINIIIALGHSGLERDKQIAAQCPEVDLVIGGHCK